MCGQAVKPVSVSVRVKPGTKIDDENLAIFPTNRIVRSGNKEYYFDKVFDSSSSNSSIFDSSVAPVVDAAVSGRSGLIVVSGAKNSGKTFTMAGNDQQNGLMQLAIERVFEKTRNEHVQLKVAYVEVFKESIYDVLKGDTQPLSAIENVKKIKIQSANEFTAVMASANTNRPLVNDPKDPSRSPHAVLQLEIVSLDELRPVRVLQFCDLAKAELAALTLTRDHMDCVLYNKSVYVLRQILRQLCMYSTQLIPYGDSKLTTLLAPTLQRDSVIAVICTIEHTASSETASTLEFASRAKKMHVIPEMRSIMRNDGSEFAEELERPQQVRDLQPNALEKALQRHKENSNVAAIAIARAAAAAAAAATVAAALAPVKRPETKEDLVPKRKQEIYRRMRRMASSPCSITTTKSVTASKTATSGAWLGHFM